MNDFKDELNKAAEESLGSMKREYVSDQAITYTHGFIDGATSIEAKNYWYEKFKKEQIPNIQWIDKDEFDVLTGNKEPHNVSVIGKPVILVMDEPWDPSIGIWDKGNDPIVDHTKMDINTIVTIKDVNYTLKLVEKLPDAYVDDISHSINKPWDTKKMKKVSHKQTNKKKRK